MIVTLGILSVFQLIFIPGLIITRLMKLRGFWINLLLSIGLSPIINYLFVLITTLFGVYNQKITLLFFSFEVVLLCCLMFPIINKNIGQTVNSDSIQLFFIEYLKINSNKDGWKRKLANTIYLSVFVLATGCILYYLSIYGTQTSSIFSSWDSVVSWDRWAVDWYMNHLPNLTWHYPQLLPANWSLTYQFMGDSRIKFFAKDYMGYIEIFILITIFILGLLKHKIGYFIGIIFSSWLLIALGSQGNGYADTPVAFWGLLSIACLILAQKNKEETKYILAGAIFAAGAGVIKQAGLWIVLSYPLLLILLNKNAGKHKVLPLLVKILIIDLIIIIPWYGYKEYQILSGLDSSEIQYVTKLVSQGKSIYETFISALSLLATNLNNRFLSGKATLIILGILLGFSYKDSFWGRLCSFIIFPFTFFWIFFFSYDIRNLNLIVPLTGLTAGIGLQNIIELDYVKGLNYQKQIILTYAYKREKIGRLFQNFIHIVFSIKILYILLPVVLIFLLPFIYSDSYMISKSIAKQKLIGDPQLNLKIYDYFSKNGLDGKILTDYQYLGFLPELDKYYLFGFTPSGIDDSFIHQFNQPQVGYALINDQWSSSVVESYINQLIDQDKIKIIFRYRSYTMVTTCHGICN